MKTIKAKVHRLPSHINAIQGQLLFDGKQFSIAKGNMKYGFHHHTPQHLYITTDEEIKEGDLCYDKGAKPGWNGIEGISKCLRTDKNSYWNKNCRKIIATTGTLLVASHEDYDNFDTALPKIPQSFIEDYCKAGGIDEVLVEYIDVMPQLNGTRTDGKIIDEISLEPSLNTLSVPKLNPDNTIIIHPVEEKMYSEAEIKQNLEKLFCDLAVEFGFTPQLSVLEKWIEENL